MMILNNKLAFFALLRAGLWGQDIRLFQLDKVDFSEVMKIAEEQSVVGLITEGLEHVTDAKIPQQALLQFIGSTLQIEQHNKAMNEFVADLINLLRNNDIYAILVKGQGIAQCYEKPLWRSSGDIDLLLSDSNYEKAKKVLFPLASNIEKEYCFFKHQGMTIHGFEVELHGTQHSRLSRRVDRMIDEVQKDVFFNGNVRSVEFKSSSGSRVQVFLPAPHEDVIFVFTHILHHFFFEGIGLRQLCDWCRLLWTYNNSLNHGLLESRLRKAGLITEWKAFAAFAVEYLGMPVEALPLYNENDSQNKIMKRQAKKICDFIMEVGNFGHNQRRDYSGQPYLLRKFKSSFNRLSDMLRHFSLFPKDSVVFFGGVLKSGLHAALRGE